MVKGRDRSTVYGSGEERWVNSPWSGRGSDPRDKLYTGVFEIIRSI